MNEYDKILLQMNSVVRRYHKEAERRMADEEIYQAQHHMLKYLGDHPRTTQRDIAQALDISEPAVTKCLKKLEKEGYVTRNPSDADKRSNEVEISEAGIAVHQASEEIISQLHQDILKDFTPEELQQLQNFLRRMLRALE